MVDPNLGGFTLVYLCCKNPQQGVLDSLSVHWLTIGHWRFKSNFTFPGLTLGFWGQRLDARAGTVTDLWVHSAYLYDLSLLGWIQIAQTFQGVHLWLRNFSRKVGTSESVLDLNRSLNRQHSWLSPKEVCGWTLGRFAIGLVKLCWGTSACLCCSRRHRPGCGPPSFWRTGDPGCHCLPHPGSQT